MAAPGHLGLFRYPSQAEEALLRRELPGYVDYRGRTKKLIQFVW